MAAFLQGWARVLDVRFVNLKPTANPSFTWVKGNHTYKFGAELIVESHPSFSKTGANNSYTLSASQTADPSLALSGYLLPSGQAIGFPYQAFSWAPLLTGSYQRDQQSAPRKPCHRFLRAGFLEDHAQNHLGLWPALRLPNLPEGAIWPDGQLDSHDD